MYVIMYMVCMHASFYVYRENNFLKLFIHTMCSKLITQLEVRTYK